MKKDEDHSLQRKENGNEPLKLRPLNMAFSICRLPRLKPEYLMHPYTFSAVTDEEISLLTPDEYVPEEILERSEGWSGLRIEGQLDFSLTGILAGITEVLAASGIPVFAVSTFRTDYIFVQKKDCSLALQQLEQSGYEILYKTDI